jgi:hypothetical protein
VEISGFKVLGCGDFRVECAVLQKFQGRMCWGECFGLIVLLCRNFRVECVGLILLCSMCWVDFIGLNVLG